MAYGYGEPTYHGRYRSQTPAEISLFLRIIYNGPLEARIRKITNDDDLDAFIRNHLRETLKVLGLSQPKRENVSVCPVYGEWDSGGIDMVWYTVEDGGLQTTLTNRLKVLKDEVNQLTEANVKVILLYILDADVDNIPRGERAEMTVRAPRPARTHARTRSRSPIRQPAPLRQRTPPPTTVVKDHSTPARSSSSRTNAPPGATAPRNPPKTVSTKGASSNMTSASQASPIPPTTPLALASSSQPPRSNSNALSQRLSSPTAAPPSQVRKHAVTSNSTSPGEVNQLASHLTVVPNPSPMVSQPGSNASPEMSPSQSLVTPPPTPASISPTEQFQVGLSNQIPPGVMAPQALARRLSVAPNMSSAASSIKSDAPPPLPPPQDSPSPPNKMPARSNAPPNPAPVTGSSPSGHRSPGASNASASPFQAPQTQTSAALSSLPAVAQANANPAPADVPVPSSRPPVSGRSSRVQSQSSSQTSSASRSLATSTSTSGQAGPPANAAHTSPSESTPRPSVIASSHSASLSSTPAQVSATTRPTASSRPRIGASGQVCKPSPTPNASAKHPPPSSVQSKSAPTPANTKPKPASIASGVETTACTAVSPSTRPPISSWKDEYMLQKERADKLQTRLSTSTKSKLVLQDELAKTVARDEDHLANLKNSVATFQAELFEARAKVVAKSAELVKANEELVAYKRTVVGAFRTQQKRMQEQEERNKVAKGKLKMILGMVEEEGEDDFVVLSEALEAYIAALNSQLEAQRQAYAHSETQLREVKQECRAPFVVPALLDAMISLSAMSSTLSSS